MEGIAFNVECCDLLIGDLETGRVEIGVNLSAHFQAGLGTGGGNEIHDDLMTDQGFPTPVLADEGEEAVFDLIPFTGSGRQVADAQL